MQAEFSIAVDAARSLIRIAMSGFFSVSDVARFVEARDATRRQLPAGSYATLVDIRGMKIQAQASVAAFTEVLAEERTQAQPLAFVVDGSLARMQAVRASGGHGRLFRSVEEAERWLLTHDTRSVRAA